VLHVVLADIARWTEPGVATDTDTGPARHRDPAVGLHRDTAPAHWHEPDPIGVRL
jgi:hypothetical protein